MKVIKYLHNVENKEKFYTLKDEKGKTYGYNSKEDYTLLFKHKRYPLEEIEDAIEIYHL